MDGSRSRLFVAASFTTAAGETVALLSQRAAYPVVH